MVRAVVNLRLNSSLRTLLIASLGLSVTACMAETKPHSQWAPFGSETSGQYTPLYLPVRASEKRYVQHAQAAPVPQLRGLRPAPQPSYASQAYRDYQVETPIYETRPALVYQLDDSRLSTIREGRSSAPRAVTSKARTAVAPQTKYPVSQTIEKSQNATTITSTGTSINQSLQSALSQSPRLAIEDLRIREAEEGLVQAKAQGRFKLNLEGVAGPTLSETDFRVVDRSETDFRVRRGANLDLSLPIYEGGRINAQKNVAEVGINSAKANYEAVESAVTQEAAIAHLNVMRDRQLIQIYKRNVTLLENQKTNVQAMVNAGENTLTDKALIDARLAAIKARLELAQSNLAASESSYKKLVGRPAPSLMPVGLVELPASLQDVKEIARLNNAQIKASQTQAEAAFHNIEVAKSFGRPKLSLQGVLRAAEGQSETIRRNSAAEVLLNLRVPLLSGGENKSRVRQAALAQSRAVLETREMQNNLDERLEQLWASVRAAQRSKAPNQAQKIAAQKAYDAIVQQRNAGVATSLDVLSVEQTLLDAELNLIEAQNAEDAARFQLLGLMGSL